MEGVTSDIVFKFTIIFEGKKGGRANRFKRGKIGDFFRLDFVAVVRQEG